MRGASDGHVGKFEKLKNISRCHEILCVAQQFLTIFTVNVPPLPLLPIQTNKHSLIELSSCLPNDAARLVVGNIKSSITKMGLIHQH